MEFGAFTLFDVVFKESVRAKEGSPYRVMINFVFPPTGIVSDSKVIFTLPSNEVPDFPVFGVATSLKPMCEAVVSGAKNSALPLTEL